MKIFNRETLKSWILEAFDWQQFRDKYDIASDRFVSWAKDYEEPQLDSLYIGEEAVLFDLHEEGYQLDYWPFDPKTGQEITPLDTTRYIEPSDDMPWLLARYVPENYKEIQESVEYFAEQKARINLKDYIESEN